MFQPDKSQKTIGAVMAAGEAPVRMKICNVRHLDERLIKHGELEKLEKLVRQVIQRVLVIQFWGVQQPRTMGLRRTGDIGARDLTKLSGKILLLVKDLNSNICLCSRDLKPWQIFVPDSSLLIQYILNTNHFQFIVISGTIGLGLFTDSGEILNLAGPCGGLVAFVLVALLVIFVMSGIAEMIHHWPISGALVEFVRSFIDGDLAIIVGIAYW
jgi:hypothetical protein